MSDETKTMRFAVFSDGSKMPLWEWCNVLRQCGRSEEAAELERKYGK
jgi:hypothetical protein